MVLTPLRSATGTIVVLAIGALVLITGMMNTAIEALCDFVETRRDGKIRVIKDVAAAAVAISIALWAVIVVEMARLWPRHSG